MGKRFYKVTQPTSRAFSEWIAPRMTKYLMACCDCGLVHELQFQITPARVSKDGQFCRVIFRVRRAEGHTKTQRKGRSSR